MNLKVSALTVHLFAYHLTRSQSTSTPAELHPLWQQCDRILEKLQIQNLNICEHLNLSQESDSPRVNLLSSSGDRHISIPFEGKLSLHNTAIAIAGEIYPLRIHDSYALALNITGFQSGNGEKTSAIDVSVLGQLNADNSLHIEMSDRSLGQTLLITAQISDRQQYQNGQFLKNLSDACIQALIPDAKSRPEFSHEGKLWGSPIFEYGLFTHLSSYRHILVWFLPNESTEEKLKDAYPEFIDLFYYRNKALRTYQLSRNIYRALYHDSQKIERFLENLFEEVPIKEVATDIELSEAHLNQFQVKITNFPHLALEYSRLLRDLEYSRQTILSNTENYTEKIQIIQSLFQADVSFLEKFPAESQRQFIEPIYAELRYFSYANDLLDKGISAIRARVEIEQAQSQRKLQALMEAKKAVDENNDRLLQRILLKTELARKRRDRNLQTIVGVMGIGLGVGALLAASGTFGLFVLSLLVTGIVSTLTWGILRLIHRHRDTTRKRQSSNISKP